MFPTSVRLVDPNELVSVWIKVTVGPIIPSPFKILVEARLERLQRSAGSRNYVRQIRDVVAVAVGIPDGILIGARTFQATSYPVAVCTAPIGVQPPN